MLGALIEFYLALSECQSVARQIASRHTIVTFPIDDIVTRNMATRDLLLPKQSFAPVVDQTTRTLILGSLPGDASLAQQQYYAHPQNRFWHLLSEVVGFDLVALTYDKRLSALLSQQIGLWDVVANATRRGSLDSQIKQHKNNDLLALIANLPELSTIAFNGGTAAKFGLKILGDQTDKFRILTLPSSSPAYTLAYPLKREAWLSLQYSPSHMGQTN